MGGDHVFHFLRRNQSGGDDVVMVPVRIVRVIPNDQIVLHRPLPHGRLMCVEKYYNLMAELSSVQSA